MKPHYSLAEAFQRGQFKVEYPRSEQTISYYCRIYPELDITELLKTDAVEGLQSPGPKGIMGFDYRDSRVAATTYGWTASLDYCNEDSGEIVHRTELTRPTKEELYTAMHEYAAVITDPRQREVYRRMLAESGVLR